MTFVRSLSQNHHHHHTSMEWRRKREEAVVWRWQRKLVVEVEVDPGKKKRDRDARRRRRRMEEEEDDGMYRAARWWSASEDCKMKKTMKMVVERRLHSNQGILVILVYVDDIIITGSNKEGIISTKSFLKSTFDIKDLGELKYFLGIEFCRSKEGLFISQRKYTLDILNEAGTIGSRQAKTPWEEGYKVLREGEYEATPFKDVKKYRRMMGKLIYLTMTRPDVCFVVNQVSQHMGAPKVHH